MLTKIRGEAFVVGYFWSESKTLKKNLSKNPQRKKGPCLSERERERERGIEMEAKIEGGEEDEANKRKWKRKKSSEASFCPINSLDDGCLMHIFSFLSPIPGTPFHSSASISLLLFISIQNQYVSFNGYHLILFLIVNSKNPIFNFNQGHFFFFLGWFIWVWLLLTMMVNLVFFNQTTTDILEYMHKGLCWLTILIKLEEIWGFKSM